MAPTLSIVVPLFNVEYYISPCLESLLNQEVTDVEVIIVNDGSTDSSGAIAEEWARNDSRIRVLQQENAGLSAARNTGTRAARGRYLAFCDSDDVVSPTGYSLLLESLEATGSDMASGDVRRMNSSGVRPHSGYDDVFGHERRRTHILRDRTLVRDRMAWNKVFRRSFWDATGLVFSLPAYEDAPTKLPAFDLHAPLYDFFRANERNGAPGVYHGSDAFVAAVKVRGKPQSVARGIPKKRKEYMHRVRVSEMSL